MQKCFLMKLLLDYPKYQKHVSSAKSSKFLQVLKYLKQIFVKENLCTMEVYNGEMNNLIE